MALRPTPIGHAALDSRDIGKSDLFVALVGENADGHDYIAEALSGGAQAIICEERGRAAAQSSGARIVDCTTGRWALKATLSKAGLSKTGPSKMGEAETSIAYIVDDVVLSMQAVGGFQRFHRTRPALRVIGITGSVGKTSTKELTAEVLRRRFRTLANPGNLNSEQGLPLTLMALDTHYERAVLEMGMYGIGEIAALCELARPSVGVITNVGPSHLSRLGTIERIAQAKGELIEALPSAADGGVAILNWDDERVRSMATKTSARILSYGLTPEAELWADDIVSAGMEGIHFRFHLRRPQRPRAETVHVRVPLLGRHSVHTALRAAAVGLAEGLDWDEIIPGLQSVSSQLRLVVMAGINGSTIIDDTYNASPASTIAALNLLADLAPEGHGRRVAVLGDMRELGDYTAEGHKLVGRRTASVLDLLVTVGTWGKAIADESLKVGFAAARLHVAEDADAAISLLHEQLRKDDLVLVKGSRAIGMERIVNEITLDDESGRSAARSPE